MKKLLFFLLLILFDIGAFAQCPVSVTITGAPATEVCKGTSIVLTANPSIGSVTPVYYWIIGNDTTLGVGSTFTVSAYDQSVSVLMSTSTGCSPDSDSAFATEVQIQTVTITATSIQSNYDCSLNVADVQVSQTGGTDPTSYDLEGISVNTTGSFTDVPEGSYNLYMADDVGCRDTGQVVLANTVILESTPVPQITDCNQTTADVIITSDGGMSPYVYDMVGIGTSNSGSYEGVEQGSYTLYTTDSDGCKDTSVVSIVPFTCPEPNPTEVITPNDDGFNDMWLIYNISYYPENEVSIFDRWGQRVYHKNGYDNLDGWQAKYVGGDLAVSTYYYVLKVTLEQSDDIVLKGAISVFR
jgi:gliding motility-associated-like protein